ncbi:MAG: DUF2235 domain-containing protein [Gemmatimonadetes bacterium]|nr:DUF2235 domain-containing protein [Gemmatimonadota bacterium]
MPRNLVICFDGTNNEFGRANTNVVRLVQVLDRDPTHQRLFYDPGVGTLPRPELGRVREWLSRIPGLAFGAGLEKNVEEAYAFLMDLWEPGDRVYIFGFSRGAYTARVLAGLLHLLGLLPRANGNLVPYVMELFRAVRHEKGQRYGKYRKLCDDFRWTYARPASDGDDQRHFPVHFVGVWDTVSSVGWVWNPKSYQFTHENPSVAVARHALALDERRWFFRQNQMHAPAGQDLQELWFPGVHCDVGGGYPESSGLWRLSFEWMLQEATAAGLQVDPARLRTVRYRSGFPAEPWKEPAHESLMWYWWPAEFIPKWRWSFRTRRHGWHVGLGHRRFVPAGSRVHSSTLRRIRETGYAPANLGVAFIEKVRALAEIPPWLATDDQPGPALAAGDSVALG